MQRRDFLTLTVGAGSLLLLPFGAVAGDVDFSDFHGVSERVWDTGRLSRQASYWRNHVGDDAWRILFRDGTEPRYSSSLNEIYDDGTYICAACHLPLFSSATKYDSQTGLPSFFAPYRAHIATRADRTLLVERTEYHCIRCGGHQGHVFEDGPKPTGERWCNNGLALRFVARDEALPPLRG